ncbi:uncharacterized protein LOC125493456 [Beta vulgaris subsp. vulgaris]|uniref:uncharacterized protein LOC125493456 n=1 Tax=Beta vulgaris subsp. vulgaris TaxID=3555 RepID=UPI002548752A|nr:uncharacterized protein LOC125493456 [Beta vulgaris subsp. vulgaris]XP_048492797.2 uncharacterized protein LOC125493456 [Beta vulgaris subsp. vulgaris]
MASSSGQGRASGSQRTPHLANDTEGENPPSNSDTVTTEEQGEGEHSASNQLDPNTLWFDNNKVTRSITECFKEHYVEPCRNWTETSQSTKDHWFNLFKRKYSWRSELDSQVRQGFQRKAAKRLKDMHHWVTSKRKGVRPIWMPEEIHQQLMQKTKEDEFKKKSEQAKKNKRGGCWKVLWNLDIVKVQFLQPSMQEGWLQKMEEYCQKLLIFIWRRIQRNDNPAKASNSLAPNQNKSWLVYFICSNNKL